MASFSKEKSYRLVLSGGSAVADVRYVTSLPEKTVFPHLFVSPAGVVFFTNNDGADGAGCKIQELPPPPVFTNWYSCGNGSYFITSHPTADDACLKVRAKPHAVAVSLIIPTK